MLKLDFVLEHLERYYFPFLENMGYEVHYDYRPYKVIVWIDGNDLNYAEFFSLAGKGLCQLMFMKALLFSQERILERGKRN